MYSIRATHQFKNRQKARVGDRVEWNEYLGPYPHLQKPHPISDALRNFFIIMRRLIHQAVCPVVECFSEAVVDGAITRSYLSQLRQYFSTHSTDESVSLLQSHAPQYCMCHLCVNCSSPRNLFLGEFHNFPWQNRRRRVSFYVFVPPLAVTIFQVTVWLLSTGAPSSAELEWRSGDFVSSLKINLISIGCLDEILIMYLRFWTAVSSLHLTKVALDAMNELKATNLFQSHSAATSVSKVVATWAFSTSLVTWFRSRSDVTCSTTL